MKSRFASAVVGLVYLSMALVFGVVHHHHDDDGCCDHDRCPIQEHKDCAACAWQLNAVTDVPNVVPFIFGCVLETPLEAFDFTSYSAPSFSFSQSRAPPAASA